MRLSNLTWPKAEEYFRAHDTVLRHMPLGTDTLIPDFLLDKIEQKSDVLICPTIPYGATESLCDYPGTINLGTELLYQVLGRVCDSLFQHGARRFVILNGHGGNIKLSLIHISEPTRHPAQGRYPGRIELVAHGLGHGPGLEGRPRRRRRDGGHPGY